MPKFRLEKLIRDGLVQKFEEDGYDTQYRTLSPEEYVHALRAKVLEEAQELPETKDRAEAISELADVYQALADYALLLGIPEDEIVTEKQRKFEQKGGFSGAHFVETIEIPENDPWVQYFRDNPDYQEEAS
jgi:predicted house-cleaning noncanonical NTP pyrophosphatase (MazG superfamily)